MKYKKSALLLSVLLSVFLFVNFVSAANTATLAFPAQDASISGSYVLSATLDTNTQNLQNATFTYNSGGSNTSIGVGYNLTGNGLVFNYTWVTTALVDINNLNIWVNISNVSGSFSTLDSSSGVDINNGNPTATLSTSSIHDNYKVSKADFFTMGLNADNTIGISSCLAYFTNVRNSTVYSSSISVVSNACTSSTLRPSTLVLPKGETYSALIQATDGNGDKTNSSARLLTVMSDGPGKQVMVPSTGTQAVISENPFVATIQNIVNSIRTVAMNLVNSIKGLFSK